MAAVLHPRPTLIRTTNCLMWTRPTLHHQRVRRLATRIHFPCGGKAPKGNPIQDCALCLQPGKHHPVECRQCRQRPGCCHCLWRHHRSPYNNRCPMCRYSGHIIRPIDTPCYPRIPPCLAPASDKGDNYSNGDGHGYQSHL